jgi:hypothetical protein
MRGQAAYGVRLLGAHLRVIGLLTLSFSTPIQAEPISTSGDFDRLPTPIQAYVLRLGVEGGLSKPADIRVDGNTDFLIPVPGSDLNRDGKPDYYAAACMFSPAEREAAYQTNGFPCAYAAVIVSTSSGGYVELNTSGLLVGATAGPAPTVTIFQRNFNDCGDQTYMCLAEYAVNGENDYTLRQTHISPTDP